MGKAGFIIGLIGGIIVAFFGLMFHGKKGQFPLMILYKASFDECELEEICNFFVASEINRVLGTEFNHLIHNLKKEIIRRFMKPICNKLFQNVMSCCK